MGFSDEELVAIGEDWQGAVIEVTVWVDGRGRVIGIERSLDLPAAAAGPVTATDDDRAERLHARDRPRAAPDRERRRGSRGPVGGWSAATGQSAAVTPLPRHTTPASLTVYRERSRSRSTPIWAPSGTTAFLSRIACRTTALRPMRTPGMSTLPST